MKSNFYASGRRIAKVITVLVLTGSSTLTMAELSIIQAQDIAVSNDAGIAQVLYQSQATRSEAQASSQLPDPTLILGTQNLPTDTFKFDQEPMTQFKVGIRQMFPQGDSLHLQEEKLNTIATSLESSAQTRHLMVTRNVRKRWLEVLYWERAQKILKEDETLFQQLLHVTQSLYSVGNVQQQDLLRAELELSRLQEKIIKADRKASIERAQLSRWVGNPALTEQWPERLPIILRPDAMPKDIASNNNPGTQGAVKQNLFEALSDHPMLVAMKQQVTVADRDIELSRQKYWPKWGIELNYGYRDGKNNDGSDRADFVSAMLNVSIPLFTRSRQDKSVQSATYRKEAQQSAYQDKLIEMVAEIQSLSTQLAQTEDQLALFDQHILSKARLQAESSLNAYQADATDFSGVMRAFISEQRDRLDYERLVVTRLQLLSDLQYYFPNTAAITLSSLASPPGAQ